MSNLKAHIKTPSHQQYTRAFLQSPPKALPSVTTEDFTKTKYKEIADKFPGRFELLKINQGASTAKCRCKYCNQLISLLPDRGSFNANFDNHMKSCSSSQKRKRGQQSSLESFIVPTKRAKQQWLAEQNNKPCLGLYKESIKIGGENFSLTTFKSTYNEGTSQGKVRWYSLPKFSWKLDGKVIEGTIRSSECSLILCQAEMQICSNCTNLVKDEPFQKRVKRSNKENKREKFDNKSCKNSRFLKEKVQKILQYRRKCDLQRLRIQTLSKRLARIHASRKTLLSKITESVNRGDVSAII